MDSHKSMHIPRATIRRLAIYVQVLENLAREGTEIISSIPLAEACGAEAVQVIGTKFVLYKRNNKEPKIQLPKDKKTK